MIWLLLSKVIGSLTGLWVLLRWQQYPMIGMAVLGILPIWLELAATHMTGIEPSLETRPGWKYLDNIADALSFVLLPSSMFFAFFVQMNDWFVIVGLFIFVSAGIFRLIRFVSQGLQDGLYFKGLPVTYTGYLWVVLALFKASGLGILAPFFLMVAAFAMVSKKIKIRRTLVQNDAT